ncbi:MAG TPA: inorganic phosphate transporter [Actinomycetes bacterium]
MDIALLTVVGIVAIALLFDYTNGFHDSANSISTIVATRVLRPRWAVLWAAFFNFIAFLFFGTKVANTIGQTVKPAFSSVAVIFAAVLGAIVWNYVTWWLRLPTSSSHALIGGLLGAGLAKGGIDAIKLSSVQKAGVFIVVSPIAGLLLAGLLMALINLWLRNHRESGSERVFKVGQLVSSAAVSLGHGTNDAQKTMGVIAALLVATGHLAGGGDKLQIPLWVVLAAHSAIALGTISGGWRIVETMGMRITRLLPARGVAAETGAAIALFGSTALGAPVSTTHTVAGSVTGVGTVTRGVPVNWSVFGQMAIAWVVTIPAAALLAAGVYGVTQLDSPGAAAVLLGAFGAVLLTTLAFGLRRTARSAHFEADRASAGGRVVAG